MRGWTASVGEGEGTEVAEGPLVEGDRVGGGCVPSGIVHETRATITMVISARAAGAEGCEVCTLRRYMGRGRGRPTRGSVESVTRPPLSG